MKPSGDGSSKALPLRLMGPLSIGLALFLLLASFGGTWGQAYGQTVATPTPLVRVADPVISKTGIPECCQPGDDVTYTILVTNEGSIPATSVVIEDSLPAGLILQEVTSTKGTVTVSGNYFRVDIGSVAPGELITITVRAVVGDDLEDNIVLRNTAVLRSDQGYREAWDDLLIRRDGACGTPGLLPPTGSAVPMGQGAFSPWLLLAGLMLLVLGVVLTARAQSQDPN